MKEKGLFFMKHRVLIFQLKQRLLAVTTTILESAFHAAAILFLHFFICRTPFVYLH